MMNKKELLKSTLKTTAYLGETINTGCAGASIGFKLAKCVKYNKAVIIISAVSSVAAIASNIALAKIESDENERESKETETTETEEPYCELNLTELQGESPIYTI